MLVQKFCTFFEPCTPFFISLSLQTICNPNAVTPTKSIF